LAVLARAGRPLTIGEISMEVPRGSEIGVRKAVARLVNQGIVFATQMGRNVVHELNRDHLAAPAADVLAGIRTELWRRLREALTDWDVKPVYACVFGSAARRDGGSESDIDLMVVHPAFPGEKRLPRREKSLGVAIGDAMPTALSQPLPRGAEDEWYAQLDELRAQVQRWTGNMLQVLDLSIWQQTNLAKTDPSLSAEITRDAVTIVDELRVPALGTKQA
jgi:predicted nucleotidyltransferase